jgi:hypothetical protein
LNFLLSFFPHRFEILPETRKSVVISVIYEIIFYRFFCEFASDSSSCATSYLAFSRLFSLSFHLVGIFFAVSGLAHIQPLLDPLRFRVCPNKAIV